MSVAHPVRRGAAPKRFSQSDLIIAATALCHGLTILSRDASDYERARAPVVDPWRWWRRARFLRPAGSAMGPLLKDRWPV